MLRKQKPSDQKAKDLIARLDKWLKKNRPEFYAGLHPGVTDKKLDELEARIGFDLPPTFRSLLRWRNGQDPEGGEPFWHNFDLISVEEIERNWASLTDLQEAEWSASDTPQWWGVGWVPFLAMGTNCVCIDLQGSFTGKAGQVIEFWHADETRLILAPTLTDWLQSFIEGLESGYWKLDKHGSFSDDDKSAGFSTIYAKASTPPIRSMKKPKPRKSPPQFRNQAEAEAIAKTADSTKLEILDLSFKEIGPGGATALAHSPYLRHVKSLNLLGSKLGDLGIRALAESKSLKHLTSIVLNWNEMTAVGVRSLARSTLLRSLTHLDLCYNFFKDDGIHALVDSPNLGHLVSLGLGACEFGPDGLRALAKCAGLKRLVSLDISQNKLDSSSMKAFASSPILANLVKLDISATGIGFDGILALLSTKYLRKLRPFNLSGSLEFTLGDAGVTKLFASPKVRGWLEFDLTCNEIGPKGAEAIASSRYVSQLVSLNLCNNRIGNAGGKYLAASTHLSSLRCLDLSYNNHFGVKGTLSGDGIRTLASSSRLSKLEMLNIAGNGLKSDAVVALAKSQVLKSLTTLDLNMNQIDAKGIMAIAGSANFAKLQSLSLDASEIGTDGAKAIAESPHLKELAILRSRPRITSNRWDRRPAGPDRRDAGPTEIIFGQRLSISGSGIGNAGAEALAHSPLLPKLREVTVGIDVKTPGLEALYRRLGKGLKIEKVTKRGSLIRVPYETA